MQKCGLEEEGKLQFVFVKLETIMIRRLGVFFVFVKLETIMIRRLGVFSFCIVGNYLPGDRQPIELHMN